MNKKLILKSSLIVMDFIALFLVYVLSNLLIDKFNWNIGWKFVSTALILSAIKVLILFLTNVYNFLWRYHIRYNFLKMFLIVEICNICFIVAFAITKATDADLISMSTIYVSLFIEMCYIICSRLTINVYTNSTHDKITSGTPVKRTLIVGAGSAGNLVLNEMGYKKEFGCHIVGFVDDSKEKINTYINNIKVYGPIKDKINDCITKLNVEDVIIAMPNASKAKIKEIIDAIDVSKVNVSLVPETAKFLKGDIAPQIRKISIDDLLGREAIKLGNEKINEFIENKTVLVTGGGGSIGSEICRQVLDYNPKQLVIFDIYENTTYNLLTELDMKYKGMYRSNYIGLIGSVRDNERLEEVFSKYHPDIVFHAAAHKHVPLMEDSPKEAIKNNVCGTYNVAKMADKYNVSKMVLISTDKAVNPTNVMGASKRFCEMVVEAWNTKSEKTAYSMVRFGNVLGSNGSVIPLFEKQIANGGPLTVTHPDINRFFMTIPEACNLVIESGAKADGGEKFILDMGKPVKILDLAKKMIQLSGLELDKDIKIEITGLRPGEKLYEELLLNTANATKTDNDKIYVEKSSHPFSIDDIDNIIRDLKKLDFKSNKEMLDLLLSIEKKKND